jgi:ferritin-like metal-binding protein YciE
MMDEDFEGAIMDAALISIAQRVEHYEIAAFGCVAIWATLLGESEAAALLEKTLKQEREPTKSSLSVPSRSSPQRRTSVARAWKRTKQKKRPRRGHA